MGFTVGLRGWLREGEIVGSEALRFGPKFGKWWGDADAKHLLSSLLNPQ